MPTLFVDSSKFSMTNFFVSVFLCVVFCLLFCFWFYCVLNTQKGGYVRITSLNIIIIIIIMVKCTVHFPERVNQFKQNSTHKLFLTVRGSLYVDRSTASSEPPLRPPEEGPGCRRIRPLLLAPPLGFWTSCWKKNWKRGITAYV